MKYTDKIIERKLAKNKNDAYFIKNQYAQYKNGYTSYTRFICTIVYLWYKDKNICFENCFGYKMHLSQIVKEYKINNDAVSKISKIKAFEKFMMGI